MRSGIKPLFLFLVLLASAGLADEPSILEISVLEDGRVLVDGDQTDIDALPAALESFSDSGGLVLYYRENAEGDEPHPVVYEVLDLIARNKLPIAFSTTADFSTIMLMDGTVVRREIFFSQPRP